MLPKPYEYLMSLGHADYYYLRLNDVPYPFLSSVVSETVDSERPRFLRKPKIETIKIPVSQKTLPLNSMVLFLLYNSSLINPITYELDIDNNKIDIYGEWDDYDVESLRKSFKSAVADIAGVSNYDFGYTIHDLVARGFDKVGYHYVCVEKTGSFSRTYWLVRTTRYGAISLVSVNESGTEKNSITTGVNVFLIDRTLIKKIMEDFLNKKFMRELTPEEVSKIEEIYEEEKGE